MHLIVGYTVGKQKIRKLREEVSEKSKKTLKSDENKENKKRDCYYYLQNRCIYGKKCYNLHDPEKLTKHESERQKKDSTGEEGKYEMKNKTSKNQTLLYESGKIENKDIIRTSGWKRTNCKFYIQGRCRHSKDGTECKFLHPEHHNRSPKNAKIDMDMQKRQLEKDMREERVIR